MNIRNADMANHQSRLSDRSSKFGSEFPGRSGAAKKREQPHSSARSLVRERKKQNFSKDTRILLAPGFRSCVSGGDFLAWLTNDFKGFLSWGGGGGNVQTC